MLVEEKSIGKVKIYLRIFMFLRMVDFLYTCVCIYMHIYKSFDFCSVKANNNDNKIPKSTKSSKLKNALSILALRNYF